MVIQRIHNNRCISFIRFSNKNVGVGIKMMKSHKLLFLKVGHGELGAPENVSTFLSKLFYYMGEKLVGDGFNGTYNVLKWNVTVNKRKVEALL